jgi:hypothetical protein
MLDRLNERPVRHQDTSPSVIAGLRPPAGSPDASAHGFDVEAKTSANFAVGQPFLGHLRPVTRVNRVTGALQTAP